MLDTNLAEALRFIYKTITQSTNLTLRRTKVPHPLSLTTKVPALFILHSFLRLRLMIRLRTRKRTLLEAMSRDLRRDPKTTNTIELTIPNTFLKVVKRPNLD